MRADAAPDKETEGAGGRSQLMPEKSGGRIDMLKFLRREEEKHYETKISIVTDLFVYGAYHGADSVC